jgi:hypothetical protein
MFPFCSYYGPLRTGTVVAKNGTVTDFRPLSHTGKKAVEEAEIG